MEFKNEIEKQSPTPNRSSQLQQLRLARELQEAADEIDQLRSELVQIGEIWLSPATVSKIWSEDGTTQIDGVPCSLPLDEAAKMINRLRERSQA